MARCALNILQTLSMLLFVASVILGIHSYAKGREGSWQNAWREGESESGIDSYNGRIAFQANSANYTDPSTAIGRKVLDCKQWGKFCLGCLVYRTDEHWRTTSGDVVHAWAWRLAVPYWMVATMSGIVPTLGLMRRWRRKRRRVGFDMAPKGNETGTYSSEAILSDQERALSCWTDPSATTSPARRCHPHHPVPIPTANQANPDPARRSWRLDPPGRHPRAPARHRSAWHPQV